MARSKAGNAAGSGLIGWLQRISGATQGAFAAWASDRQWRRILLIALVALAIFVPGQWSHGPTDRDEGRFIQASKQMLESGDFIDIRFQDEPRHKKPVGIYWLQAASASLFGGAEAPVGAFRIPSLIGAVLASLLGVWALRPLIGARAALLAGVMIAGLLMLNVEARIAKTDAFLLACVVASMGALARLWFGLKDDPREHAWYVFYFWTALAVGTLIKGPIVFLPVLGVILWLCILEWNWRGLTRLGWSWGVIWFALIALPWFVAIGVKTEGAFFFASVGEDMMSKVASGQEAHGAPPGFYLLALWGTFWPWTALLALAVPWAWRWRRAPETAFLLGWIIPVWILFELVPTKLPHYVLPVYPALIALAAAAALDGSGRPRGGLFWICAVLWAIPALVLPIGIAGLPFALEQELVPGALLLSAFALLSLILAWRWLLQGAWIGYLRGALIGAGLTYASAFAFALPALDTVWISERITEQSAPYRACAAELGLPAPFFASAGYREPSLVFLMGTDTALISPERAAPWLMEQRGPAGVWIKQRDRARFEAALPEGPEGIVEVSRLTGFNYNRGKEITVALVLRADDPALACTQARFNAMQSAERPSTAQ
ncbi:MAG: glycosyltransferase family 39 protein [Neomegalonema sp.]|nr:glycosyltransferase family 39 protein [Neomegalonema sp.]